MTGGAKGAGSPLHFVVLHHTGWPGHPDHFDLMLQTEPGSSDADLVLKTFATLDESFPDGRSHADVRARGGTAGGPDDRANLLRLISDHRRAYLTNQGSLSGGRGAVSKVDEGGLEFLSSPDDLLQELRFRCSGTRLQGEYRLRHMGGGTYVLERKKR